MEGRCHVTAAKAGWEPFPSQLPATSLSPYLRLAV
jgi:hypothetical protein